MRSLALSAGLAGLLAVAGACRHGSVSPPADPSTRLEGAAPVISATVLAARLSGTSWRLVRLDDREPDPDLPDLTLRLRPARAEGSAGCNWYTAWLEEGVSGRLVVSHLAVTRRDCVHPRIMNQEARYLEALEEITGYGLHDGELALTYGSADREGRLVFVPTGTSGERRRTAG